MSREIFGANVGARSAPPLTCTACALTSCMRLGDRHRGTHAHTCEQCARPGCQQCCNETESQLAPATTSTVVASLEHLHGQELPRQALGSLQV